jgi:hypothetical protein
VLDPSSIMVGNDCLPSYGIPASPSCNPSSLLMELKRLQQHGIQCLVSSSAAVACQAVHTATPTSSCNPCTCRLQLFSLLSFSSVFALAATLNSVNNHSSAVCRWSAKLQQNLMELAGQADKSTAGSGQQPAAAAAAAAAAAGGGQVVSPQN